MAEVILSHIDEIYGDATHGVRDLNLRADDGSVLVLVGPSGCSKTTAPRIVAGLDEITAGTLQPARGWSIACSSNARDLNRLPGLRGLPAHDCREQHRLPLRLQGLRRVEREEKVRAVAKSLGLEAHLDRRRPELSGGQRQRIAMGRALVREPTAH
jgi:ABC-type sugar transport system ATPase subunit